MENVKSDQQPSALSHLWRKARSPLLSAIRQDVWGPAHQAILDDMLRIVRVVRERRRAAKSRTPVALTDTFDSLARRKRYTEEQLRHALTTYLRVHWSMYSAAGLALVYALWLALNVGVLPAAVTCLVACGAAVHGYLYGYRAWQIRNRKLRTLADAMRDIDTYLVI